MKYDDALAYARSDPKGAENDAEFLIRDIARKDYLTWCEEVGRDRGWAPAAHHKVIIQEVERVISGNGPKRLLITAPPGSAKSTYTSELLPAHLLSRFPGFNLIGASNTSTLAEDFSERTLALIDQRPDLMPFRLRKRSAPLWTTTNRGRYRAAGVGVAIAGNRADGVLIDDPVRSREDADSELKREKVWNWFTADLRTRLKPGAWIIVIMTRWHEDDLGGRLLERQKGMWEVLNIPAQALSEDEAGHIPPDALARKPGEWLWSDDDYGYGEALQLVKREFEQAGAMRDWRSLYMGQPSAGEGTIFKVAQLVTEDVAPTLTSHLVRAWDLAATKKMGTANPDWTVGVLMMRDASNRYWVLDVVRFRGSPEEVERAIINTAKLDGKRCTVRLPQDPGQAGKAQISYLTKQLAGFRIVSMPVSGDKSTRAAPAASQLNVGNVSMVKAAWNAPFRDELASFPSGSHDDQVDAFADAFSMIALNRPLVFTNEAMKDLRYGLGRGRAPRRS